MEATLAAWLVRYGAPVLFLAQVFGIFGLPIPDELLLTMAGALVARGLLPGSPVLAAAIAGCLTGITLSYALGRFVGIRVIHAIFRRHQRAMDRTQAWFRRFGGWLLAFGYFIPGVRHVTAISAGSGCLDYAAFAGYAYPGGAFWCLVFLGLGYYAGDRWREVAHASRSHFAVAALVVAAAFAAYSLVRMTAERRRA